MVTPRPDKASDPMRCQEPSEFLKEALEIEVI